MIAESGTALRQARLELGLKLEQVSAATRIPVQHLQAVEDEHFDLLPVGPYRLGQVRAYCEFLKVQPSADLLERMAPPPREAPTPLPRWVGRGAAAGLMSMMLLVFLWLLMPGPGAGDDTAMPPPVNSPDQRVHLVARRTTQVKILVDGEVAVDRTIPGGEAVDVAGHRRVEVHLEGADAARVEYNGDLIVPQGRQDVPRRLVFIDDLEAED